MSTALDGIGQVKSCPGCGQALTQAQGPLGMYWQCPACGGRLVALPVLRKTVSRAAVGEIWGQAIGGESVPGRACPECGQTMRQVCAAAAGNTIQVDICTHCTMVWFYGLAFPQARFCIFIRFCWVRIPAYLFILFWVAMQIIGAVQQLGGFTNVSALAHLGGAATGVLCWFFWRKGTDSAAGGYAKRLEKV